MNDIDALIRQLRSLDAGDAEEAQASLSHLARDVDVVAPLLAALPGLGRYGQLCAIEVLDDLGDTRAVEPLTSLLATEDVTVREWAAGALGGLGQVEAVPALNRAYRASRARQDPPEWTEPVALRRALTELGARHPVVPPLTASLRRPVPPLTWVWPAARLGDVLDELAAHGQAILYFQLGRADDDQWYWIEHRTSETEIDYTQPWPALVEQAHQRAVNEARDAQMGERINATIEWIDYADL